MKTISVLFLVFFTLLSCRHPAPKNVINDSFLVGQWGLCKIIYLKGDRQLMERSFNVCPVIIFSHNHSGFIRRSDPILLYFNWRVSSDKLLIKHTINKDKDDIVDDGAYKIIHPNNKPFHEIDLFDTVKNIKYILGR